MPLAFCVSHLAHHGDAVSSPPLSQPTIELTGVTHRFTTPDGRALTALRDINLTGERGEFVAVVGPTGCGKSTTLEPDYRAGSTQQWHGACDGPARSRD